MNWTGGKHIVRNWLLFLLIQGFPAFSIFAQPSELDTKQIYFEQLPESMGLSHRTINAIIQDEDGYIWVGTWSGLMKYDGNKIETFQADKNKKNWLTSNKVTSLLEDREGNILIGTRVGGIFKFDKFSETFEQWKHNPNDATSLSSNYVWDIGFDQQGRLWVATEKGVNYQLQDGTFNSLEIGDGMSYDEITSLGFGSDGVIWATSGRGLNRIVPAENGDYTIETIYFDTEPGDSYDLHNYMYKVQLLTLNGKEHVFVATQKGIKEWDGKQLINHVLPDVHPSCNVFRNIELIDGPRPLLLLGSEKGLAVFDLTRKQFSRFLDGSSSSLNLSHNTVTELFIDQTEVLWVGSKRGINKFDTRSKGFRLYKNDLFDPGKNIVTGIQGHGEDIWISTLGGGVYLFDPSEETFTKVTLVNEDNPFIDFVQKFLISADGQVIVGTAGAGAFTFYAQDVSPSGEVAQYQQYCKTGALSGDYVMSIANAGNGDIWIGTWSEGLNRLKKNGEIIQYGSELFKAAPLVEILEVGNTLWVGSRGNGLYRLEIDGDSIVSSEVYQEDAEQKISFDFISNIYQDRRGHIWICTEQGINLFEPKNKSFREFTTKDGLITSQGIAIIEDDQQNLWISNWEGITVVSYEMGEFQVKNHFDAGGRLRRDAFYNGAIYKDDDGLLFMGGAVGFNVIDPMEVAPNPFESQLVISSISIHNQEIKNGETYQGRVILQERLEETTAIELEYFENAISLEFNALHFASPENLKYSYRLLGYEQEWRYTDQSRPFANYTNLSDGTYQFQLRASNNDGIWSNETRAFQILIYPPWWKTKVAFGVYFFLILLFLVGFRKLIIIRTNYENNLELERLERENLEANSKAKLRFFTNISHEFRTPLTLIMGPVEKLLSENHFSKEVHGQLSLIRNNTNRLLQLINQLLDFRKVESGHTQLKVGKGNFVRFVKEIKLSFDAKADEQNIQFDLNASSPDLELFFDRDQCEKIMFNLISNAFKYTPRGGDVTISIEENHDEVVLIVKDNGPGISEEEREKIFERFYSNSDASLSGAGTGIGLALVNSLVKLHHGKIEVRSEEQNGSEFLVSFKKGSDHFDADQIMEGFVNSDAVVHYVSNGMEQIELAEEPADGAAEKGSLLIIEDNKEVRSFIRSLFISQYEVLEADNGESGFEIATDKIPDLVVSDVMMPVMDGITFCKKLKTNPQTSHIPVILLTARTSLIFKTEGYENGADDYISKPFDGALLKTRVRKMIEQRQHLQKVFSDNKHLVVEPSMITYTSTDEVFMKAALQSVEDHMDDTNFSVEDMGKEVGFSRMKLYRKLKSLTGQSPNEFIRIIRLKRAAQLLKTTDHTVAEVTYMVGFGDLQYFRECFKKEFDINPSEYAAKEAESL